ncbi:MAG: beta-N-acetylhexosaminidase [Alphaproteobacteria bacterium]|nr:beta-N-acetylhexosaminidase [Alphaproteobacteria bacterium]
MSQALAPLMLGIGGMVLTEAERDFIRTRRPFSFILFARSIESPDQMRELTAELAALSGTAAPLIAVDQEGGRVQRLTFGGRLPPVQAYGQWYAVNPAAAEEMVELHATLLAHQLREVGATWLLGPCLDLALPETHAIIGNRAFAADPAVVTTLGRAFLRGVRAGGCFNCIKHAPGHGRTSADTHVEMPTVDADAATLAHDAQPFAALAPEADFIMTAHIRYPAWDAAHAATFSPKILGMMKQQWGHRGLVLADDLGMHALKGPYAARAAAALAAGCDGVIAALSVIKHGMAGTFWDEENFHALQAAMLPALSPTAHAYVANLTLPPALSEIEAAEKIARFRALWASRPAGIDAPCTV